ncbi:MAG: hypothetical protein HYS08_03635 [Chlamydiae bacterium]|nr:hypothetical protein [Chlamydiota bacterium]MBI3266797.1 hypothetical protein [Chlamydiota bacterium]
MELSLEVFRQFQRFLVEESGLYFSEDRKASLQQKLDERIRICERATYEEYFHYLKFHPQGRLELKALLDLLTIGETYFFRNEPQFEALRDYVLPNILKEKKDTLRIWSAGCSTGEEPYSIAMLLREHLTFFENWEISILATDINQNVLKAAQEGIYNARAVHAMPTEYLQKYFVQKGQKFWISEEIKKMVQFQYHNLVRDPFSLPLMQNLDILFCRNVIIYFNIETIRRILSQFAECLLTDGFLFVGHAETLWNLSDDFSPIEFPQTFLYQKTEGPASKRSRPPEILLPSFEKVDEDVPMDRCAHVPMKKKDRRSSAHRHIGTWVQMMSQAVHLANEGRYEEALIGVEKIIHENNLHLQAHFLMGVLLAKLHRYEKAVKQFERVLYIDEKMSIAYFHLGHLYRLTEKFEKAKKAYENCLNILEKKKVDEIIPFSEGLTVGVLNEATHRALETLKDSTSYSEHRT